MNNTSKLKDIEKSYLSCLVRNYANEGKIGKTETKTQILKFLDKHGFINKKEKRQIENLAFETHALRPNCITHSKIEEIINEKLSTLEIKNI